jgi:hypothetical protein
MMEGLVRILVVALGLLFIWWLCGPAAQRDRPARREGEAPEGDAAHVDVRGC